MTEPKIFITCRPDCADIAKSLYERLSSAGFKVVLDLDEADAGSSRERLLLEKIRSCTHFLPVLNQRAASRCANIGDTLRRKLDCALENRKKIIPFFEGVTNLSQVPEPVKKLQSGLSFQLTGQNLNEVTEKLKSLLPAPTPKTVSDGNNFATKSPALHEENISRPLAYTPTEKKNMEILPLLIAFLVGALIFSLFGRPNIQIEQHNDHGESIGVPAKDVNYNQRGNFQNGVIQQNVVAISGSNAVVQQNSVVVNAKSGSAVAVIQN